MIDKLKNAIDRFPIIMFYSRLLIGIVRQLKKYGIGVAPTYIKYKFLERKVHRANAKNIQQMSAYKVQCTCCGWNGKYFLPVYLRTKYRKNALCPDCGCRERHRAYSLYYKNILSFSPIVNIIFISSPEPQLKMKIKEVNEDIKIIDCDIRQVDVSLVADLTKLSIKDESFDKVICHHVLEHILDDKEDIKELKRITKINGEVYIAIPQNEKIQKTIEWNIANPLISNHVREYGNDFIDRLFSFKVEIIDIVAEFSQKEKLRYGFNDKETIYKCKKIDDKAPLSSIKNRINILGSL